MENLLIIADMEGCIGVNDLINYDECIKCMENEITVILDTLRQEGDFNIILLDCHNDGRALKTFAEKNNIEFIQHLWNLKNTYRFKRAIMVGFHAKKGSVGILSHTLRPEIDKLLLGDREIGEVELVVNYLSYFNINIIYISGDLSIKNELIGYKGVFCPVKSLANDNQSIEQSYAKVKSYLAESLTKDIPIQKYNSSKVKIKLISRSFIKFIPRELFSIRGQNIICKNTIDTFIKLKDLCFFLNLSESYLIFRVRLISDKIKSQYTKEELKKIRNHRIRKIFEYTNWRIITDKEIKYLYKFFNKKTKT